MRKIILAAAVAALSSTSALAADMAARHYKAAPAPVAPIYNWTGLYIGGFVGGSFNDSDGFATNDLRGSGSRSDSSFFGGGQIGANYQLAPSWIIGVEGDIGAFSSNNQSFVSRFGESARVKSDWVASVTGRLGYTWSPTTLIYAKGGVAFRDDSGVSTNTIALVDRKDTGYTVGGGIEYLFSPAWSGKIEYQYYDFDRTGLTFLSGSSFRYDDSMHTVKAGLNYHFNWNAPFAGLHY